MNYKKPSDISKEEWKQIIDEYSNNITRREICLKHNIKSGSLNSSFARLGISKGRTLPYDMVFPTNEIDNKTISESFFMRGFDNSIIF